MRPVLCFLATMILLAGVAAAEDYSLVRVHFDGTDGGAFLAAHPELDVATVKPGHGVDIVATPKTMDILRGSGLRLEVVHEDLEAHYASRIQRRDTNFGGWHTYSENIAYLDSLRIEYPDRISEKWSIGQSHEGRDIWAFRISDNPDIDETGEPEFLLDTMHHAREIMAGEFGMLFADYMCRNYGTDPVVTWLMNNREFYLVSIVNPDGVVYNETIQPQGGGMWRKNRRNNGGGSYGVDPNRNYPFEWIGGGSSSDPDSETYRGPSPASEPEIQALIAFINSHEFVTHNTLHTSGNLTLVPWGYTENPSPDDVKFHEMGDIMARYNGYSVGTTPELLYPVNGVTTDWTYGDTTDHEKMWSFTNEIGTTGFWPGFDERDALFQDNVWPMTYLMMAAGAYADVENIVATDAGGGTIEPGESGELVFDVVNHGVTEILASAQFTVSSDDPYVQFAATERTVSNLATMGRTTVEPLPFTVSPECPDGHRVSVTVTVDQPGGSIDHAAGFLVGTPTLIFSDDFTAGTGNWTFSGGEWGLTSTAYSAPNALTDSPSGDYDDYWNATAQINDAFYATELRFWHRYDIEDGWDYGYVEVSANGGAWQRMASYTGTQNSWQEVTVDLSEFAGQSLRVQFRLSTDTYVTEDGWYIDDVSLLGAGDGNQTPPPPPLLAPGDGATVGQTVQLTVGNVIDPEGDDVTYGFRVYTDLQLTQIAASVDNYPAGDAEETNWSTTLTNGTYYWRAYAADSIEWGLLGEVRSFIVDDVTATDGVVIGAPRLAVLGGGSGRADLQLTLPLATDLKVKIYNARGMLVRDLYTGAANAGTQVLTWDGRDRRGGQAASGVYFVRVVTGNEVLTDRVVMVR